MSDTTPRDQLAWTDRDELADLIGQATVNWIDEHEPGELPDYTAGKLLAAGWRPPARTVTTWEEVQSLKEGALLTIERGGCLRVYERQEDDAWCLSGAGWLDEDWLPATVIYEPEGGE